MDPKGLGLLVPPCPGFRCEVTKPSPSKSRDFRTIVKITSLAVFLGLSVVVSGCGPKRQLSDIDLETFDRANPLSLDADSRQFLQMRAPGAYHLVPGDLLSIQMPAIVRLLPNRAGDDTVPYLCRVDSAGRVVLPIIEQLQVVGMTLAEVEAAVTEQYYPKYVRREPSIVASVAEYSLSSVSVVGAVTMPGVYELRSNENSLIAALTKAGGIVEDGASTIRISGAGLEGGRTETIAILDKNVPVRNVELRDGDTIIVEPGDQSGISVVGLVKKPGMFPWNSSRKCTVMDALAFAGGVNDLADPQYVRVYRESDEGEMLSVLLKIVGPSALDAGQLRLKARDIVVVEPTPRTRSRLFLSQIIRMGVGVNAGTSIGP